MASLSCRKVAPETRWQAGTLPPFQRRNGMEHKDLCRRRQRANSPFNLARWQADWQTASQCGVYRGTPHWLTTPTRTGMITSVGKPAKPALPAESLGTMSPPFLNELRTSLQQLARHTALVHLGRACSYADLDRLVRHGAALLQQSGMEKGDRVVLWTAEKFPFLIAHLSILHGGGISLPLNPKFTREEMRHFLTDSGARLAVAAAEQFPVLESLRPEATELHTLVRDVELTEALAASPRHTAPTSDDPCLLVYSSGTTGWPKGIVHTNANVAASLRALGDAWRFTPDDVVVNVLPLFHIHGLSFATQLTLLVGGCVLLEDAFHPVDTLDVIGHGTVFMGVPTIYYRFLEQPAFPE